MRDLEKVREKVEQLNVIDDTLFQKMAEDSGFCEELISTCLGRAVKVIQVIPQESIRNLQGRSVILDALCAVEDDKIDDGSDIAELMKIFTEIDAYDYEKFPNTSTRKAHFKNNEKGEAIMCDIVEEYAQEVADERAKEVVKDIAKKLLQKGMNIEEVAEVSEKLTREDLERLAKELQEKSV